MQTINTTYLDVPKKLAPIFQKIGIDVTGGNYRDLLLFNMNKRNLSISSPLTNNKLVIKYDLNEKLKQAVLSITEQEYKYTQKLILHNLEISYFHNDPKGLADYVLEYLMDEIPSYVSNAIAIDTASDYFDNYIDKTNYSSFKKEINKIISKIQHTQKNQTEFDFNFTFILKIRKRTTNLLIGYDHDSVEPFICQLPKFCQSVKAAHNALIPEAAIGKKYLRQGEWFFIRVTDSKEKNKIFYADIYANKDIQQLILGFNRGKKHLAEFVCTTVKEPFKNFYVKGAITSTNHNRIILNSWHKVVRNTELINKEQIWD